MPETEKIKAACPACKATISAPATMAGKSAKCPKCSEKFTVKASASVEKPNLPAKQSTAIAVVPKDSTSVAPKKTKNVEGKPPEESPAKKKTKTVKAEIIDEEEESSAGKMFGSVASTAMSAFSFVATSITAKKEPPPASNEEIPPVEMAAPEPVKPCPYCSEIILRSAKKCKHCGEFLDGRQSGSGPQAVQHVTIVNQVQAAASTPTVVVADSGPKWDRGTAILLSMIIPGAGQMYKGQPINGIFWFLLVICGYAAFLLPGVILHFCCILGAASGDNR